MTDTRISRALTRARYWAGPANLGYNQARRTALYPGGASDCSSFATLVYHEAGYDVPDPRLVLVWTGNMRVLYARAGFQVLAPSVPLQPGDCLLAEGHHTAIYLGGGVLAEAAHDEHGHLTGGADGDQTGQETRIRAYYAYPWTHILRPPTTQTGDLTMSDISTLLAEITKIKVAVGDLRDSKWPDLLRRIEAIEARTAWIDDRVTKTNSAVGKIADGRTDVDANVVSVDALVADGGEDA